MTASFPVAFIGIISAKENLLLSVINELFWPRKTFKLIVSSVESSALDSTMATAVIVFSEL